MTESLTADSPMEPAINPAPSEVPVPDANETAAVSVGAPEDTPAQTPETGECALLCVYLYNSIFKGLFSRWDVRGHCNNVGTNGAGKSSLLNLIPVFLGLDPGKAVDRASGKKNFTDYYLPSNRSFLAFEYLREGQHRMLFMFRQPQGTLAYRFVKASGAELFPAGFEEQYGAFESCRDYLAHGLENFTLSDRIDRTCDYRAIIQNDRRRLARVNGTNPKLIYASRDFAFCPDDSSLKFMDALDYVILNSKNMLDYFKNMVIECFLKDKISADRLEFDESLQKDIRLCNSCRQIRKDAPLHQQAVSDTAALTAEVGKLVTAQNYLSKAKSEAQKDLKELKDKLADCESRREKLQTQFSEQNGLLNSAKKESEADLEKTQARIDKLQTEKLHYEDDEQIADKKLTYDSLPVLKQKSRDAADFYEKLINASDAEKDAHEKDRAELQAKSLQTRQALDAKIAQAQQKIIDTQDNLQQSITALTAQYKAACQDARTAKTKTAENLEKEAEDLRLRRAHALMLTPDEENKLGEAQKAIAAIKENGDKLWEIHKQTEKKIKEVKEEFDGYDEQCQRGFKLLQAKKDEYKKLQDLLEPSRESLKSALEDQVPNWRDNIGKVISPALLAKTNLSPKLVNAEADTFYGVELDLSKLTLPDEAQEQDVLTKKRDQLLADIGFKEKTHDQNTAERTRCSDELTRLNNTLTQLGIDIDTGKSELKKAEETLKNLSAQFESEHEAQAKQFDEPQKNNKTARDELEKKYAQDLENLSRENDDNAALLRSDCDTAVAECKEAIAGHTQAKLQEVALLKNRLRVLDEAFASRAKDRGTSEEQLKKAAAAMHEAEDLVEQAEGYRDIIEEYERFMRSEYSELKDLTVKNQELSSALADLKAKIKALKDKFSHDMGIIGSEKNRCQAKQQQLEERIQDFDSCFNELGRFSYAFTAVPASPALALTGDSVTAFVKNTVAACGQMQKKLQELLYQINSGLYNGTDDLSKVWQRYRTMSSQSTEFVLYAGEFCRNLQEFTGREVNNLVGLINNSLTSVGLQIDNFYSWVDSLNGSVKKVSGMLEHKINTQNPYEALQNIRVGLTSTMDDQNKLDKLRKFHNVYGEWRASRVSETELPPDALLDSFEETAKAVDSWDYEADLERLVELHIALTENGREVIIKSDEDLRRASSQGLSKLAVIVVFCGMTRYLCGNLNVTVPWALDELGMFADENVMRLFELLNSFNIKLIVAEPNPSPTLRRYFDTKNEIRHDEGIFVYRETLRGSVNPLFEEDRPNG